MSKSRMVNTRFWSDSFVVDKLNALDRYLYLYLLTNERTNIIGIYELSLRTASFETGIEKDDLVSMLKRLTPKVEYNNGWVYIRRFTDHQQSNPSVDKGILREFFALPDHVINWVKELGVDSPKLMRGYDILSKAQTDSTQTVTDSPQAAGNLTKLNLTKPNGTYVNSETNSRPKASQELFYSLITTLKFTDQVKFTDGRKRKLSQRLKQFSETELTKAAETIAKDKYLQGDNPAGKRYGTIDYLLRNDETVDKYLNQESHAKQSNFF